MAEQSASNRPLYAISVAAELAGLPVPTLRLYERRGLVEPARTRGGTRRYSDADVERLRRISDLVEAGANLAGVGMVLALEDDNAWLRTELAGEQAEPEGERDGEPGAEPAGATAEGPRDAGRPA